MKLEINTESLKDLVKRCASVMDSKTNPVLDTIIFRATPQKLELTAGDGQSFVCARLNAGDDYKTNGKDSDEFEMCIVGALLNSNLNLINDDTVVIHTKDDGIEICGLVSDRSDKKAKIRGIPAANYVDVPIQNIDYLPENVSSAEFKSMGDLYTGLNAAMQSVMIDNPDPKAVKDVNTLKFCGIAVLSGSDYVSLYSTDRHAMFGAVMVDCEEGSLTNREIVLPGRVAQILKKALGSGTATVIQPVDVGMNWIQFTVCAYDKDEPTKEIQRIDFWTSFLAGEFASNVDKLVTDDFVLEATVNKKDLQNALVGCALYGAHASILLDTNDGVIVVESMKTAGHSRDMIECPVATIPKEGAEEVKQCKGAVNIQYLSDVLKGCHTDTVKFAVYRNTTPAHFYVGTVDSESKVFAEYRILGMDPAKAMNPNSLKPAETKVRSKVKKEAA